MLKRKIFVIEKKVKWKPWLDKVSKSKCMHKGQKNNKKIHQKWERRKGNNIWRQTALVMADNKTFQMIHNSVDDNEDGKRIKDSGISGSSESHTPDDKGEGEDEEEEEENDNKEINLK